MYINGLDNICISSFGQSTVHNIVGSNVKMDGEFSGLLNNVSGTLTEDIKIYNKYLQMDAQSSVDTKAKSRKASLALKSSWMQK